MIRTLKIRGFKGLREVELALRPFTVVVGANDTGKSSILQAILLYHQLLQQPPRVIFDPPREFLRRCTIGRGEPAFGFFVETTEGIQHQFELTYQRRGVDVTTEHLVDEARETRIGQKTEQEQTAYYPESIKTNHGAGHSLLVCLPLSSAMEPREYEQTARALAQQTRSRLYKLNPEALKQGARISVSRAPEIEEDGSGLPSYLDDLRDRSPKVFRRIEQALIELFPELEAIGFEKVEYEDGVGKQLIFHWKELDRPISALDSSDGLLLFLTYLTLVLAPNPPAILLLEEPENGIYPRLLEKVVGFLRQLSRGWAGHPPTQVILTTHSPLLLNWMEPEELVLCTKDAQGQISARNLPEPEEVRQLLGPVGLSEMWYALGEQGLAAASHLPEE